MTKKEMIDALAEVIKNNSNIEADEDDSVFFLNVKNVLTDNEKIIVQFENDMNFAINVEQFFWQSGIQENATWYLW